VEIDALCKHWRRLVNAPRIDVVTPLFNEEANFQAFIEALEREVLIYNDVDWHFIFVDDGSTDRTWEMIEKQCSASQRFRGMRLSRNFGFHSAVAAGIDHSTGDAVATLAADLQDPPATLIAFVEAWMHGAEIVWGWRRSRVEPRWRILASNVFAGMIRRFALPHGSKFTTGSFLLIDRKVVACLRLMPEHTRVTFARVAWTGFRQEIVQFDRSARYSGRSRFSFGKLLATSYDTFVAYSSLLPRLVTVLGLLFAIFGFGLAGYSTIHWLMTNTVPGWTGLMVTFTIFFGVNFLILGTMIEYLLRIYLESTARPPYFIAQDTQRKERVRENSPSGRAT
jgi:glycosyltransferase involved in cell wall biosynthesis